MALPGRISSLSLTAARVYLKHNIYHTYRSSTSLIHDPFGIIQVLLALDRGERVG